MHSLEFRLCNNEVRLLSIPYISVPTLIRICLIRYFG